MHLASVKIENFRAHSDTELPMSQLGCLIGENNAGKSTVLHALQFALDGGKLPIDDFRDNANPIQVTVQIDGIREDDLARVADAHRDRVREMVRDGTITLNRRQEVNASPEIRYMTWAPADPRWSLEIFNEAIKGLKGANLREAAIGVVPELHPKLDAAPRMGDVKEAFQQLVAALPDDELEPVPEALKTGIWQAVKPMLPEVIYIEAVKDVAAETRSSGTATFGKLLGLLLSEVQDQFANINEEFQKVQMKLSRILANDGTLVDERLEAVKRIESTIQSFVQESFPGVKLTMNVPAPSLTTILNGAELRVDDGHDGPLVGKGDGLKRTVLFAILRAYTEIRSSGLCVSDGTTAVQPCILLFEEPELYLHPRAQRQLMATLSAFSEDHQVLVTTHSAGFFGPSTGGFAKLIKEAEGVEAMPVDLKMSDRDSYQLVRYENNEAAFFAQAVVLVEGDSDTFTFPHLAKLISADWDHDEHNITFIKTGGKGSIARYRNFFAQFGVRVHVITDLDALAEGFKHLTNSSAIRELHSRLMAKVEYNMPEIVPINSEKVRSIIAKRNASELWVSAQEQFCEWKAESSDEMLIEIKDTLSELFNQGKQKTKTDILKAPPTLEMVEDRDALIDALARERVHVLRRGDLEAYCGQSKLQGEKVSAAMSFCREVTTLEAFKARHNEAAEDVLQDLKGMFSLIFADVKQPSGHVSSDMAGATTTT